MAKEYLATQNWVKELFAGGGNLIVTSGKFNLEKGTKNITIPHPVGLIMMTQEGADKVFFIDRNFHTTDLQYATITVDATFNSDNCKITLTNTYGIVLAISYYALS